MSLEDEARSILMKAGLYWPDADSGKLRSAATAWRTFADAVDDARGPVNTAARTIIEHNSGEAVDAFNKFWARYAHGKDAGWLSDLSQAATKMAEALDKLANVTDDAVNKLWTQIGIDAAVIAAGVGLAIVTAGIASGAAAAAAEAIIEIGGTLGVAVTTTVAEIAAGTLVAAAFGGLESVTVDLAVAQPLKMATGQQKGFSLDDVNEAAESGMLFGGTLGAGAGVLKAGAEGAFANQSPFLLRPPSLRPDLVDLGPAARRANDIPHVGEPIDVATGAMLMTQTDLTLPGDLPFAFTRTHLSSYRAGACFGPTWISTLDECVQIDGEGVVFAAADGMRLVYPVPRPGVPALPLKGPCWPLEWDGAPDGVMTITDPQSGVVRTFSTPIPSGTFGTFHLPLDSWHDCNGARLDIDRTAQGVPSSIHHSGGYHLTLDTMGHRITALRLLDEAPSLYTADATQDGAGTVIMRYGYDEAGNLTEVINSSGTPLRFTYDNDGRVTSWKDRNNTTFSYVYDTRGRVIRTEGSDGFLSGNLTYDDTTRTTTYANSLGHTSRHRCNTQGQVIEETNSLGHTTRTERDPVSGNPLAITDPLGRTTAYAYDSRGNLTSVTLPNCTTARAAYNGLSQPVEVIEPGGSVWRHRYDDFGNRLTTIDPLGAETHYSYDGAGRLTAVTNALGHTHRLTPNAAGLPISICDELGETTTVRRDGFGRIVEVTNPLGHTTRTSWTVEGRPESREYADGSREAWVWDAEGNLLAHTSPLGETTRHTVAHFDVPAARTGPDGAVYSFAYDTELQLTEVTNPQGRTWTYTYDQAGRLTTETDFNGRTLIYAYDAAGDLLSRTNGAGQTLHFTRDMLGRVVERRSDTDEVTTFAYDPYGELIRAVNADAEIVAEYDALGHLLNENVNGRSTSFSYDALGRCTRRTTPSGLTSTWTYDQAGRPVELRTGHGSLTFAYDAAGREVERTLGHGATLTQTWDVTDRLTTQSVTRTRALTGRSDQATAQILQHRSYAHRTDGHLTEIRDLTSGTRRYDLDSQGRITAVRAPGWAESYAYDTTGNLTHAIGPGHPSVGKQEVEGTLVRRAGNTTYAHDKQGRLIRRTRRLLNGQALVWTYTWDPEDHLTAVQTPQGETWRYAYDPLGRRVSKHRVVDNGAPTDRTEFAWEDTRLAEQKDSTGQVTTWEYAPDSHRPLAQTDHHPVARAPGVSYLSRLASNLSTAQEPRFHAVITDMVGTPTELVTCDGRLAWQLRTTLWGTALPSPAESDAATCPLRFPGQYADDETGLHYNYFRYYTPETGRYLTQDPLGLVPAPNPTTFVDNPHSWCDPLGLSPCAKGAWAGKADFSSQKVMSKKFHAHGGDFLTNPGNLNKVNLGRFEESMRDHMTTNGTSIYRFSYRKQGQAVGFIDPSSQKMVMLHTDGRFWSAWKLSDSQFQDIIDKGFLW